MNDFCSVTGCVTAVSEAGPTINFGDGPIELHWDSINQRDFEVGDIQTYEVDTVVLIQAGVIC